MRKKINTVLFLICMVTYSYGQNTFVVSKIEKLDITGYNVQFSPNGTKLLYTSNNFKGLKLYNLEKKSIKEVTSEQGAGYQPAITNHDITFNTKGEDSQLQKIDIVSGEKWMIKKTVNTQTPKDYVTNQKISKSSTRVSVTTSENLNSILITNKGNKSTIAPLGQSADYINPSVSSDGSKVLFRVSGIGSFICDLAGNILKELGDVEFPKWINDKTVLFTITKDDGHQYLSSNLYITNIETSSKPQPIAIPSYIALYPDYNPRLNRIVFNTPNGAIVLVSFSN